ncbi:MAG: AraC family transcriptional regulator [Bacteriovoracaceae bacterium]|jgi:AraC-like DNA-binding protein|nr:AraC family transcriptional regulator [Bacteriovoracaceae bacterium]
MSYTEYRPSLDLEPFVDCFWSSSGTALQSRHIVVPDNRVDIIFSLEENQKRAFFSGPMTRPFETSNLRIFAVRFFLQASFHLFQIPLSEFTDQSVDISDFMDNSKWVTEMMDSLDGDKKRIEFWENYLRKKNLKNDPKTTAIKVLLEKENSVAEIGGILNLSRQQVRRVFLKHTGLNPKTFQKIQRFQNLRRWVNQFGNQGDWSELGHNFNYYDQSHFAHDIKSLTTKTPTSYFSN